MVFDIPDLTVTASPNSLYVNSNITLNFTNRLGQTLNVDFYAGNTKLNETTYTAASDTFVTKCPAEWITSGNSVNVTARVSDSLGRTATSNQFTLSKITGGDVGAIRPTGNVPGSGEITFEWAYTGPGSQKSALLEISYDQNNWETLATLGSGNTSQASAYRFRAGRLYWRVTTTNSYNLTSQASSSATITYDTLSVAATPQSVIVGENLKLSFTNRISRTLSVDLYSGNIRLTPESREAASNEMNLTADSAWFETAGVAGDSMSVQARVSDDLGRTANSNNVTVKKQTGGSVTAISPTGSPAGSSAITFEWQYVGDGTQVGALLEYSYDQSNWETLANITDSGNIYPVNAYRFQAGRLYWRVTVTNSYGLTAQKQSSATITYATLSVEAKPGTVIVDETLTLTFTNRLSRAISVDFYANGIKLNPSSYTAASESMNVTADSAWFTTAGITGTSMSLQARIRDDLGRTANSNSVTVKKKTGGSVTLLRPTGSPPGNDEIIFEWQYNGDGTQRSALVEYSYDQSSWQTLTNTADSLYRATSYRFRTGRLYWRVTVTNSYGLTAQAQSSVTITYDTLSVAATPQSLYTGAAITLDFTNRLSRAISVDFYSSNIKLNPSSYTARSDRMLVTADSAWFNTAGVAGDSMSVQARVSDDLGRTATSNNVTVNRPQGMRASPSSPRSEQMDGAGKIPFTWTASGDGEIVTSQIRWGLNGVDWSEPISIGDGETIWRADPLIFPAGTIYWQVRISKNSFGLVGEWSSSAQFTVKYNAVSQVVPVNSPTSGVISASIAETFTVALEASGPVYSPFIVQEATYYWRSNEMGSFTAVAMTPGGNTASVTIPAGTFESGTLEWYAEATDTTGRTTQTDTFFLTALVASIEAVPLSPINTVEAGNAPIVFRWRYGSIDGSPQSRAELQYSADGNIWVTFGSSTGTGTNYTAPADTFPGRTIQWRARAYNADNIAGPWSNPVSFVVVGATVITAVEGDGKPFLTVSWQTLDQLAYEVRIDGQIFGPYRDESARSLQVREPLADGIHDIAVRAQNQYGLWSAWKEAQTSIANVPGTAVLIAETAGSGAGTAGLTITGGEASGDFLIYRDGILIGRTAGRSYTDRTASPGAHEYFVIQALAGGYYTKSNTVTLSTEVKCPMIALLSGGEFLVLELSAEADRSQTITKGGEVVYVQYSGAKFPEAEVGEAESLTVTGDGSFTAEQEAEVRRFEAMLKKPVIYKTPGGEVVVGVLQGFTRRDPKFFKSYGFSVTQMEWRDYTNA